MVAQTSIDALGSIEADGTLASQKERIKEYFRQFDGCHTRRNIGADLNMELGTVAGRCNELIAEGYLQENGCTKCPSTGKKVTLLMVKHVQC